jgi:hypothetical protein
MKKRLTDRFVQSVAPPASGRAVYLDDDAPGLKLRVSAEGRKATSIRLPTWSVQRPVGEACRAWRRCTKAAR